jgi:hypothetical protein
MEFVIIAMGMLTNNCVPAARRDPGLGHSSTLCRRSSTPFTRFTHKGSVFDYYLRISI